MKLNFKKPILLLNGEEAKQGEKTLMLNEELAGGLSVVNETQDPLKLWEWAQKLYSVGEIELDTSDLELLKNTIKSNRQFTVLLKGQILHEIAKQVR